MDIGHLTKELKAHGVKVGMFSRGLYTMLAEQIPDDAPIVAAAEGLSGTNKAPIIVTPAAIYLAHYPGMFPETFTIRRSDVTGIDVSGGILVSVTIRTAGGAYNVEKVGRPDAQKIAAGLPIA